jgi:hypothetical protein
VRNVTVYLVSVILIAGALSAVVAMATVTWIYPHRPTEVAVAAAAPSEPAPAAPPAQPPAVTTTTPAPDPGPAQPAGPEEQAALEFIRRAAAGDSKGALALTAAGGGGITAELLQDQVTRFSPSPQWVARLPAAPGSVPVLVWVTYGRDGALGLYQVTVAGGKVRAFKGPMAPEGGYGPLPMPLLDEQARPLDLTPYKGHGLVLISPRQPEPDLADILSALSAAFAPKGVDVVLVLDIRSPDMTAAARAAGYKGPVWRVKGRLEDVPLVAKGTMHGAYGVLVDRTGIATASLAALEPLGYGLSDETPLSIAPTVFKAYGLTE